MKAALNVTSVSCRVRVERQGPETDGQSVGLSGAAQRLPAVGSPPPMKTTKRELNDVTKPSSRGDKA